ncbi:MAG: acyclic terpene utilization AtuA family protein [Victivallaceae bacterium]|nr:acyclic terpene utilization AtuA family protein [Victivallaceae bacterium]
MIAAKEFKVLSPTAILGYGFPEASFKRGLEMKPDLIAVDAGSVDPGPYYLGAGKSFTDRAGVKRDLRFILRAAAELDIPAVIGSAGGSGARPHVDWCREIIEEICAENHLNFKMGIVYADISKTAVLAAIEAGKTEALHGLPELDAATVARVEGIVAQMGIEPLQQALAAGCRVVLAGRAYDPSVFAALPVAEGFDKALALHMGKILECAAIAATPGSGSDCVMGILRDDHFELVPLNPLRKFTAESTAAHTLYEKSDPYYLPGPGGRLNLKAVRFEEVPGGRVRVYNSRFEASERKMIKLEGVEKIGYRTVSIAGMRDPIMISKIADIIETVRANTESTLKAENIEAELYFHIYGKNGVMGVLEPEKDVAAHELGIVIEAVAPERKAAASACSIARSTMLHYGYPGRIATAGNLAFPFSPSDMDGGEVYVFSIYHLMENDNDSLFKMEICEL